jgi:hypothetical protein
VLSLPAPTPPTLSDFNYDPQTNTFDVNLSGEISTAYILMEADDLDFENPDLSPIPLDGATASAGTLDTINETIVSDETGNAIIQDVSLGQTSKDSTFIRAARAP